MTDRIIIVLSDIEMGVGGDDDDVQHEYLLAQIIDEHTQGLDADVQVDLVFNGDTFDLIGTPIEGRFPAHITSDLACQKLDQVLNAHTGYFARLRAFLAKDHRKVHFVVGNHDPELLFPAVQARLAELCGGSHRVNFPGFELEVGPVHIEHGSQLGSLFRIPPERPFIGDPDDPILNLPWGAMAVMSIWGRLRRDLGALDRIRPRKLLFEMLPGAKTLMLREAWRYWSHDFWRDFIGDPLKHVTWPMIKEIVHRFATANADIDLRHRYEDAIAASPARLFILGHEHRASRHSFGGKTLITSGCLRNEYVLDSDDGALRPAVKGAVKVRLSEDRIVEMQLLRLVPTDRSSGLAPAHLRDLAPVVERYLVAPEQRGAP